MEKLDILIKWCTSQFGKEYATWMKYGYYEDSLFVNHLLKEWGNPFIISPLVALSHNSYYSLVPFTFRFVFRFEEDYVMFKMRWL